MPLFAKAGAEFENVVGVLQEVKNFPKQKLSKAYFQLSLFSLFKYSIFLLCACSSLLIDLCTGKALNQMIQFIACFIFGIRSRWNVVLQAGLNRETKVKLGV
ncbi:hypothetical protein [Methanosarcina sp. UBA5]|uniref:hypothetical protein n=1 Tax=Methanosarcina sp. UBA5 TaxID=1915593 RepID=UPI0025DB14F3|nr:hypothetical protein [Methanosarcina sp. UBA5]